MNGAPSCRGIVWSGGDGCVGHPSPANTAGRKPPSLIPCDPVPDNFRVLFPAERSMFTSISKVKALRLFLLLTLVSSASAQSARDAQKTFAHTDHKQMVDAAGKPLLIRATN